MKTLPLAPHIVAQTVHFETRKALDANAPDDCYKVITTTWSNARTTVNTSIVR